MVRFCINPNATPVRIRALPIPSTWLNRHRTQNTTVRTGCSLPRRCRFRRFYRKLKSIDIVAYTKIGEQWSQCISTYEESSFLFNLCSRQKIARALVGNVSTLSHTNFDWLSYFGGLATPFTTLSGLEVTKKECLPSSWQTLLNSSRSNNSPMGV